MNFNFRKLLVGFATLGVVLIVYMLYVNLTDIPEIKLDSGTKSPNEPGGFETEVATVGQGLKVGNVEKARFLKFNEKKQVIGEWGFEKLLYQTTDHWEIEKP